MSSITTAAIDTPVRRSVERTCDDLAILALVVVGIVASFTFRDYGLGWDDYTHAEYADLLLKMYGSGFTDTGALCRLQISTCMAAASIWRPRCCTRSSRWSLFETRRLLGAIVGVIGLARHLAPRPPCRRPDRGGLATLLLVALCPTFYGHMFMNPKDMPFAMAMVILMLGLVRLVAGVSEPVAAHGADPRPRRRLRDRLPHSRRPRADLRGDRLHPAAVIEDVRTQWRPRDRASLAACRSTCCCRASLSAIWSWA